VTSTNQGTTLSAETISGTSVRLFLWILLIVQIFNFLDRQIVNILAEPIKRDLGLSDTQIGLMTGLAFALLYSVLGIPIARFSDRSTTDRIGLISLALFFWSGMTALCGLVQNFGQMLAARVGVGIGEAGCSPAAHSLISDLVPAQQRPSALAFYASGISIGGLLGSVLGGQFAEWFGWRVAFMAVGLPGVLLALIVLLLLRDPRKTGGILIANRRTELAPTLGVKAAMMEIIGTRALVLLILGGSFASFLSYGKATWVAIFFMRSHGFSVAEAGLWLGIAAGVAGIVGTWLGGWLAVKFGSTNRRHVLTAPAIGMVFAAPAAFAAYFVADWRLAIAFVLVPGILNALYFGPTYSSVQGLVRPELRALASAVMIFSQNLIGLGLGPLFFGMLSDWFNPIAGQESVRWVLYGAAWMSIIPAFFFWRTSLYLNKELDVKR
jgi:predicted MFS family arabinose efflux permease